MSVRWKEAPLLPILCIRFWSISEYSLKGADAASRGMSGVRERGLLQL